MVDKDDPSVQVLIIVPTRELAIQTAATMKKFANYLSLEIMGALGGTSIKEDILRLENPVHIIVATPGRILDLAEKEVVDLSTVKIIILDEVDKLLSINFMPVTEKIFEYLSKEVQILLFSATYPKETTMKFQKKYIPNPNYVNMMSQNEVTLKGVTQYYAYIEEKEKLH